MYFSDWFLTEFTVLVSFFGLYSNTMKSLIGSMVQDWEIRLLLESAGYLIGESGVSRKPPKPDRFRNSATRTFKELIMN